MRRLAVPSSLTRVTNRSIFTWFGHRGEGNAGPTPENMQWHTWHTHSTWAREDVDYKLDGTTLKDQYTLRTVFDTGAPGLKPGDPLNLKNYKLDGWEHILRGNTGLGNSRLRIPEAVDPVNWRPLSTDEAEIFDKRREHHVKNRRKFWVMKYNPKTETYFQGQWSDRNIAQYEWSNSGWFRLSSNQWWTSAYWITNNLTKFIGCLFAVWWYMAWHEHNSTPGRIWAPATDMVNWEIEIVDMDRNLYKTIGKYENGKFVDYRPQE